MSQQINLFNPIFLRQKKYFSAVTMVQALAAVVVGVIAMYVFQAAQTKSLERLLAETERQTSERREQLVRFSKEFSAQGRSKLLEDEVARLETRLKSRQELLGDLTLGVGGDAEGYSGYLAALARQTMHGVWLTGITIGGKSNQVDLKGRALDSELMPAYLRSLSREPKFAGRRIAELRLTARAEDRASAAAEAAPKPPAPRPPARFIEFSLSIPVGEEPAAPGSAAGTRGAS
jgi:hypothetical protein